MTSVPMAAFAAAVSGALALWLLHRGVPSGRRALTLWGVGCLSVAVAESAQVAASLSAWSPFLFRTWYLAGAVYAAAWLGLGSIHQQVSRTVATVCLAVLASASVAAGVLAVQAPLVLPPTGASTAGVILSRPLHQMVPWFNVLGTTALVVGAARSLARVAWSGGARRRMVGLGAIGVGALTAAFGGMASRLGDDRILTASVVAGMLAIATGVALISTVPSAAPLDGASLRRFRLRLVKWTVGGTAALLTAAMLILPLLPWTMGIVRETRPSLTATLPARNRGAYLLTASGAMQLYPWLVRPASLPSDAPLLPGSAVREIATVQRAVDRLEKYQLYALSTGTLVRWTRTVAEGSTLHLTPPRPLASGGYMLVVPSDGMFGGQSWHYFRIR